MLALTFAFEDQTINAKRDERGWEVAVFDHVSGEIGETTCTDQEFGCVMALACGSDEVVKDSSELYVHAEKVMERLGGSGTNLRIIP